MDEELTDAAVRELEEETGYRAGQVEHVQTVTVVADDDGAWSFRWSWGDRIALVDEVAAAAFKIAYVLTPQAG